MKFFVVFYDLSNPFGVWLLIVVHASKEIGASSYWVIGVLIRFDYPYSHRAIFVNAVACSLAPRRFAPDLLRHCRVHLVFTAHCTLLTTQIG